MNPSAVSLGIVESAAAESPDVSPRAALSVIIPAYNEERAVGQTVREIALALAPLEGPLEILVVDDGSQDQTAARAAEAGARVLRQPRNQGYGAALKAGIAASRSPLVAIIDADGTYPPEALLRLLDRAGDADMVVGARAANSRNIAAVRKPAKWFLGHLASYLAGHKIPDLNSGLRVFRRSVLVRFIPILPSGFSFTTTITLALLCTGYRVAYEPIEYLPRVGKSKIKPYDFVNFLILVLRTVVLFNPLKVFLPLGSALFAMGFAKFIYDLFLANLSESAVMAILAAIIIWSVGLLADMIARLSLRPPGSL